MLYVIRIINCDVSIIRTGNSHNEVLLKSCCEHRVTAVVDVFADDIDSAWGSHEEGGHDSVKGFEASRQICIAWSVDQVYRPINILVNLGEISENWNCRTFICAFDLLLLFNHFLIY